MKVNMKNKSLKYQRDELGVLNIPEFAKAVGLSERTIHQMLKDGRLAATVYVGGWACFSKDVIPAVRAVVGGMVRTGPRNQITPGLCRRMESLKAEGLNITGIAGALGLSISTVSKHVGGEGAPRMSRDEWRRAVKDVWYGDDGYTVAGRYGVHYSSVRRRVNEAGPTPRITFL